MQIECKNVSLCYENRTVLQSLSFGVNKGDYLCIVGENGSGKSTLVKALLGLKTVTEGKIIFGDGLTQSKIGYLPQQNDAQKNFPASVWEIVLSGRQNSRGVRPFYSAKDKQIALQNIEKLGIESFKSRSFSQLSGGQRQRVLLARALCATSQLLLLDEPVAGLDVLVTHELYDIIKKINADGTTIIMVSHDIRAAVADASHILHLHGEPVFFGTSEDYAKSETGKKFLF